VRLEPVHIGCSGWNYPHWRGSVYPRGLPPSRWLEHYATLFDTVEVNSTFYRLASPNAVARWVQTTPPDFVFALKASRYLTHVKQLRDIGLGVQRFYAAIGPLLGTPKLGPVLWQLPESFERDDERLAGALRALPVGRHCFEFRHPSWFADDVYALLREHRAALVIGDHPERQFQAHELTTSWTYVRMHCGRHGGSGAYSDEELRAWGQRIAGWRANVEVFVYFNNDWEAFAVRNARCLRERLT
jgi:uncharacterized protein YecE (DUF72 family)